MALVPEEDATNHDGVLLDSLGVKNLGFGTPVSSDGGSGAVVAWIHGVLKEGSNLIVHNDMYTQRISSDNSMMWGKFGIFLGEAAYLPRIIGQNPDSTLVCWTDIRTIYAQKLDREGSLAWENAVEIGHAGSGGEAVYYNIVSDGEDRAVIVWNSYEDGHGFLHTQHIDAGGNLLWGDNGTRVSTVTPFYAGYQTPARVVPDGEGGYLVTWVGGENVRDRSTSWIQRISAEGEIQWGSEGIRLD